jgi:hypothetical protein
MMKRQFTVWHRDLFELDRHEFDVVLALNVFHHLVKEKASYDRLARWLNRLRCKVLYLETGDTGPYAYRDLSEKDFVEFVIANSCLNNRRLLGPTKVKRNLYMLTP